MGFEHRQGAGHYQSSMTGALLLHLLGLLCSSPTAPQMSLASGQSLLLLGTLTLSQQLLLVRSLLLLRCLVSMPGLDQCSLLLPVHVSW